jgi:hypothetical protein
MLLISIRHYTEKNTSLSVYLCHKTCDAFVFLICESCHCRTSCFYYTKIHAGDIVLFQTTQNAYGHLIFTEDTQNRINGICIGGEKQVLMESIVMLWRQCQHWCFFIMCVIWNIQRNVLTLFYFCNELKIFDRVKVPTRVLMLFNELYK